MSNWTPKVGMQVFRKNNPEVKGTIAELHLTSDRIFYLDNLPKYFWDRSRMYIGDIEYWLPLRPDYIDSEKYNKLYE